MGHHLKIRIYYEDTDCGGVVYYANYLRYCERARTEYLESGGASMKQMIAAGYLFVVAEAALKYHSPARYGDILDIETTIDRVGPASIVFRHAIRRSGEESVLVDATVKLGCVNQTLKPVRMPAEVLSALGQTV